MSTINQQNCTLDIDLNCPTFGGLDDCSVDIDLDTTCENTTLAYFNLNFYNGIAAAANLGFSVSFPLNQYHGSAASSTLTATALHFFSLTVPAGSGGTVEIETNDVFVDSQYDGAAVSLSLATSVFLSSDNYTGESVTPDIVTWSPLGTIDFYHGSDASYDTLIREIRFSITNSSGADASFEMMGHQYFSPNAYDAVGCACSGPLYCKYNLPINHASGESVATPLSIQQYHVVDFYIGESAAATTLSYIIAQFDLTLQHGATAAIEKLYGQAFMTQTAASGEAASGKIALERWFGSQDYSGEEAASWTLIETGDTKLYYTFSDGGYASFELNAINYDATAALCCTSSDFSNVDLPIANDIPGDPVKVSISLSTTVSMNLAAQAGVNLDSMYIHVANDLSFSDGATASCSLIDYSLVNLCYGNVIPSAAFCQAELVDISSYNCYDYHAVSGGSASIEFATVRTFNVDMYTGSYFDFSAALTTYPNGLTFCWGMCGNVIDLVTSANHTFTMNARTGEALNTIWLAWEPISATSGEAVSIDTLLESRTEYDICFETMFDYLTGAGERATMEMEVVNDEHVPAGYKMVFVDNDVIEFNVKELESITSDDIKTSIVVDTGE